jgi:hypothetical protein
VVFEQRDHFRAIGNGSDGGDGGDSGGKNSASADRRDGSDGKPGAGGGGSGWLDIFKLRPGGDKLKSGPRTKTLDLSGIEGVLHSIFLVLAVKAGNHWELSEDEATQVARAIANVARHYAVARTQKAADWFQLIVIVAVLAFPRAVQSYQTQVATPARQSPQGQTPPQPARPAVMTPSAPPVTPPFGGATRQDGQGRTVAQTPAELDPGSMIVSHLTVGTA